MTRRQAIAGAALTLLGSTTAARAQGSVYRIGALNPVTGAGGTYGAGMQKTILFALDEVKRVGIDGRTLDVSAEDTQTAPDAAVLAARKLVDADHVDAILGTWSSSVSLAVQPITNGAGVLLFHVSSAPALSAAAQNAKHLGWRFQAGSPRIGAAYAAIAERNGAKNPAFMAFNNDVQIASTNVFRADWEKRGGKIAASVVYEPNRTSYAAELQKILAAKPDFIVVSGYLPDTTIILREAYEAGNTAKIVIPGWAFGPSLVSALGNDVLEGLIVFDSVPDVDGPAFKAFDAGYQKAMGTSGLANVYAAMCYDMVNVLALALQKAGPSANNEAIAGVIREIAGPPGETVTSFAEGKAALKSGKAINYEGASGPLDFDENGDAISVFGVNVVHGGKPERKYVLK
ncbi:MAG: ABC transporter substrate-binding protein [Acetobacteraceae bacterium]|nr:ABC transporter substrate-binding protein [Acetobacteraceae bacterium]